MTPFMKDVFAIFVGGILGALFASSLGVYWVVGILTGGGIGYLTRLVTEWERCKAGAENAFRTVSSWKPYHDWRERLREGALFGLGLGGLLGVILGFVVITSPGSSLYTGGEILIAYVSFVLAAEIFAVLTFTVLVYVIGVSSQPIGKWMARNLNAVSVYYHLVRLMFVSLRWTLYNVPMLLKTFFRFVHHEDFTACAFYAMVNATVAYTLIGQAPLMVLVATLTGAVLGAGVRRVVVHFMPALNGTVSA